MSILPAAVDAKLSALLAAELRRVEEVERAAFDGPSRSAAHGWRLLYSTHLELAAKRRADGDAAKLEELLANIAREVQLPSVVLTEAERRTLAGAAREVGAGVAKDAAQLAQDVGRSTLGALRVAPWALLALGLLYLFTLTRKVAP